VSLINQSTIAHKFNLFQVALGEWFMLNQGILPTFEEALTMMSLGHDVGSARPLEVAEGRTEPD
jgi:hypothetical protein